MILTFGFRKDGAGLIILAEPVTCKCGRVTFLVVNSGGRTKCVDCDSKEKKP